MIPGGNESLGPKFYEKYFFLIFMGLWRHQMTSSIYQYPLITYDVIDEVGKLSKNIFWKVFIIPEI